MKDKFRIKRIHKKTKDTAPLKAFRDEDVIGDLDNAFEHILSDAQTIEEGKVRGFEADDEEIFAGIDAALQEMPEGVAGEEVLVAPGDTAGVFQGEDRQRFNTTVENELRELFEEILMEYIPNIKACINKIFRGDNSRTVVNTFRGVLAPLKKATETLQLSDLETIFHRFEVHLARIEKRRGVLSYKYIRPFSENYEKLILALSPHLQQKYFRDTRFQANTNPLIDEIMNIKQIGPKRLKRIYSAGLLDIDSLRKATVKDINAVTGIGLKLSRQIKKVAKHHYRLLLQEKIGRISHYSLQIEADIRESLERHEVRVLHHTLKPLEDHYDWLEETLPEMRALIEDAKSMRKLKAEMQAEDQQSDEE